MIIMNSFFLLPVPKRVQVVFDLQPARLTTARLYDRLDHTSYRTYDNFCPHIYIRVYNEIRLTTTLTYDRMVETERGRKSNTICTRYVVNQLK